MTAPADVVVTGMASVVGATLEAALAALPDAVRARAARAERVAQLTIAAAHAAVLDAQLPPTDAAPRPACGLVLGTAFGCFLSNAAHARQLAVAGPAAVSPRTFAATVSNAATGETAIALRLGGPAVTVTAGRVAGLIALREAASVLRRGAADVLVAGGADAWGEELARWTADAGLRLGPGDGAAFLVLERAAHAARRGAPPRATLTATAVGFVPDPHEAPSATCERLVREVAARSGVAPEVAAIIHPAGDDGLAERALVAGIAALESASGHAAMLVLVDECPSGHVAAAACRVGATS